jgi:hypothetical protein
LLKWWAGRKQNKRKSKSKFNIWKIKYMCLLQEIELGKCWRKMMKKAMTLVYKVFFILDVGFKKNQ